MKKDDLIGLYYKYIGNWGGKVSTYRFEALKDGKVVKELNITASSSAHIEADASTGRLHEGKTYDVALVRLRAVDQNGNLLSFSNDPVSFETEGPIEVIGPKTISLGGGMGGVYVRSTGVGQASLYITDPCEGRISVPFTVTGDL